MKNRLKRLLGKKEKENIPTPFALTILVDPVKESVAWNLTAVGPVRYEFIYGALDKCRDAFKLEENNSRMRAQVQADAKKMDAEEKIPKDIK